MFSTTESTCTVSWLAETVFQGKCSFPQVRTECTRGACAQQRLFDALGREADQRCIADIAHPDQRRLVARYLWHLGEYASFPPHYGTDLGFCVRDVYRSGSGRNHTQFLHSKNPFNAKPLSVNFYCPKLYDADGRMAWHGRRRHFR